MPWAIHLYTHCMPIIREWFWRWIVKKRRHFRQIVSLLKKVCLPSKIIFSHYCFPRYNQNQERYSLRCKFVPVRCEINFLLWKLWIFLQTSSWCLYGTPWSFTDKAPGRCSKMFFCVQLCGNLCRIWHTDTAHRRKCFLYTKAQVILPAQDFNDEYKDTSWTKE